MKMRLSSSAFAFLGASASLPFLSMGQQCPAGSNLGSIEGEITNVTKHDPAELIVLPQNGGTLDIVMTVQVMGSIDLYYTQDVFTDDLVATPSGPLTLDQATSTTALPGRSAGGFIGGTVQAMGCSYVDDTTTPATTKFVADDFFTDLLENVVIGTITDKTVNGNSCTLSLEGLELVKQDDPEGRMTFVEAVSGMALPVDYCSVNPGDAAAVEGYYGDSSGKLHIFHLESDAATPLVDPSVSVFRAKCDNGELVAMGGASLKPTSCVDPDAGGADCTCEDCVELFFSDGATVSSVGTVDAVYEGGESSMWRANIDNISGGCAPFLFAAYENAAGFVGTSGQFEVAL